MDIVQSFHLTYLLIISTYAISYVIIYTQHTAMPHTIINRKQPITWSPWIAWHTYEILSDVYASIYVCGHTTHITPLFARHSCRLQMFHAILLAIYHVHYFALVPTRMCSLICSGPGENSFWSCIAKHYKKLSKRCETYTMQAFGNIFLKWENQKTSLWCNKFATTMRAKR